MVAGRKAGWNKFLNVANAMYKRSFFVKWWSLKYKVVQKLQFGAYDVKRTKFT